MEAFKKEALPSVVEVLETTDRRTVEILTASRRWVLISAYGKLTPNVAPHTEYVLGRVYGDALGLKD